MKYSNIVNYIHSLLIFYLLFGGFFINQRGILVVLIPTLQYQFLINNNKCILTQLEEKLINRENKKDNENKIDNEIKIDSFIFTKMKEYNIIIEPVLRDRLINTLLYCLFIGNIYVTIKL
tara:strand:+ start:1462 stop:1821 length:360 start_codon:yes stop_codon:yes gene_type:complete